MSVTLLRPYGGFATAAVVTLPDSTEAALIAQGIAVAQATSAMPAVFGGPDQFATEFGNIASAPMSGVGAVGTSKQGPAVVANIAVGSIALTGYETNGVVQTAWTLNFTEIYCPAWATWTGAGCLQGTTVGATSMVYYLMGSNGAFIANTLITGTASAGASTFQQIAFTAPVTLPPGVYYVGVQQNATGADTIRHVLSAFGAAPLCGTLAGTTFAAMRATLVASGITVPTTFTTAVAPIVQLYV